ncbi:DUF559 domain-containing protein [Gordonibacter sp. An230]|uniref:DUF559 domain-containing protein n=1 Tax=Gordonibacter sp. An230 TaxID=1965592 RepID=UPI000B37A436|nr:DUF559 domain-containing protein [Gordonibacter sp. An230]OUO91538.1 DUF559 domain-containing protein [Gordonibacter sp. An230]
MAGTRVYFSHRTSLQLLRTSSPAGRAPLQGPSRVLPDRAPSAAELAEVVERLRAAHRGILIDQPVHVLVATAARRRLAPDCHEHVCAASLAGREFLRLAEGAFSAGAALALAQAAAGEKSPIALLELVYEACGTYQTRRTGVGSAYNVPPLACVDDLRAFVARNPSLDGAGKLGRILRYAADRSASARETKQALVLGLPLRQGGEGLGIPRMNFEVRASPAARAISGRSSFRCDLCWPEARLDVEYQSRFAHEGEASRLRDSRRTNALMAMGWTVIGVTNDELDSLAATETIARTIRRHLGKRSQFRIDDLHARKLKLRRQLGLGVG